MARKEIQNLVTCEQTCVSVLKLNLLVSDSNQMHIYIRASTKIWISQFFSKTKKEESDFFIIIF